MNPEISVVLRALRIFLSLPKVAVTRARYVCIESEGEEKNKQSCRVKYCGFDHS